MLSIQAVQMQIFDHAVAQEACHGQTSCLLEVQYVAANREALPCKGFALSHIKLLKGNS